MMAQNQLFEEIMNLPKWQKALLGFILIIIIYFTLQNVVFYNTARKLNSLKNTYREQVLSIQSCQNLPAEIASMKKEIAKNKAPKTKFITKRDYPILLTQIAMQHIPEVKIVGIRPGPEDIQNQFIVRTLEITCEGTLSGLKQFATTITDILQTGTLSSLIITNKNDQAYSAEIKVTSFIPAESSP